MSAVLNSDVWHRVAALRPRLRSQARLYRHCYRGEVWYLLQDPATGRVHRFAPTARLVIAAMDGQRSVEALWHLACRHLGEEAPTQDDMVQLLGQMHGADLLQTDVTPDTAEVFQRSERERKASVRRHWSNPMAVRLPLWDPNLFLERLGALARPVWGRWGALAWFAVVLPALLLLPPHWGELTQNFSDRVLAVDNLLLLWLIFPLIKLLHELGHAFATKAGGGEVHDLGLMFLVLVPVPYVDVSAATVFKSKYHRALVGAAGMLVELFIAALAFYFWLLVEPGMVRAALFNVMLVAGVSTVLFNGNPLLRFDAYYILADLIEIPNLAQRSQRYWAYLAERYLFKLDDAQAPTGSPTAMAWLLVYGLVSSIYRVLVSIGIALFVAGKFFIVGVILALWALASMVLLPLFKALRYLAYSHRLERRRLRAMTVVGCLVSAVLLFMLVVPVPYRSQSEGVVWLPEEAMVRASGSGFFEELLVEPGTRVRLGTPLLRLDDPTLKAEHALAEARVRELEATYLVEFVASPARAEIVRERLQGEQATLVRLRERLADLTVRAGSDGVFALPQAADLPGRYFRKGELLGYVAERVLSRARVVVTQAEVDLVRRATAKVELRLAQHLDQVLTGQIVREVPAGEARLPSAALAVAGGGAFAIDPQDSQGTRTFERLFQFDIDLPLDWRQELFGQRVHVRFDHYWEPLAVQWYRSLRRLFLSHFHV